MTVPDPAQQAVIDHPFTPLRVVAGAGAGKTSTMARRMARYVAEARVRPDAVLGLTFTNKAAAELRQACIEALGRNAAPGTHPTVLTYHGFAGQLLRAYGGLLGLPAAATVVPVAAAWQLLDTLVDRHDYDANDAWSAQELIGRAISLDTARRAQLLSLEQLAAAAAAGAASPDPELSLAWQRRAELLPLLADYERLRAARGLLDFADQITWANLLLTRFPELAQATRARYGCCVLDEYQDTDPAQRTLLRAIYPPGSAITAVGDADQTIYAWRGASLANFTRFPHHFPLADGTPAPTLSLDVNYRSGSLLVAFGQSVADAIPDPGGTRPAKHVRPSQGRDDAGSIDVRYFATAEGEAAAIAGAIRDAKSWADMLPGQPGWSAFAVLCRRLAQIAPIRDALLAAGIPVEVRAVGGLLDRPEVVEVTSYLKALADPGRSAHLARALLGPRWAVPAGALAILARLAEDEDRHARPDPSAGPRLAPSYTLYDALANIESVDMLPPDVRARLAEFRDEFEGLAALVRSVDVAELVRRVLAVTGLDAELDAVPGRRAVEGADAVEERELIRQNLYLLLDLADGFAPLHDRPSLRAFLSYLDQLPVANEEPDEARPGTLEAVTIMTVHQAKGTEFPAVFIPGVVKDAFPGRGGRFPHTDPSQLPPVPDLTDPDSDEPVPPEPGPDGVSAAAVEAYKEAWRGYALAGETRLFYVAVTRAQHRLWISGAAWSPTRKTAAAPSHFYDLARAMATTLVEEAVAADGPVPGLQPVPVHAGVDALFPDGWAARLAGVRAPADVDLLARLLLPDTEPYDAAVATYGEQLGLLLDLPAPAPVAAPTPVVSVSGVVTYARCPRRFFWTDVMPLPRRPGEAARRGLEVHRYIELHARGQLTLDDHDLDLTPDDAEAVPARGETGRRVALRDTFLASPYAAREPVHVERPFRLYVDGFEVRGRIDAIYAGPEDSWEIVDFKTGAPPADPGPAALQLGCYALAVDDGAVGASPPHTSVTFVYLGTAPAVAVSRDVDSEWLGTQRDALAGVVAGVRAGRFEATPSPACARCDFLSVCDAGLDFLARTG